MVNDRALAEDLAQEAFARAYERLATYDQERRFSCWFFQILHNVTVDYLRRKRPALVSMEGMEDAALDSVVGHQPNDSPDKQAEQAALSRAVDSALAQIKPEYREAVILRYREDLSVEEGADVMALPVGTVKTNLHRARNQLASILSELGWDATRGGGLKPLAEAPRKGG
jgi:RNA polymerase sigma-70 factor (ECF subfamily)